jgi:hypothetical protein
MLALLLSSVLLLDLFSALFPLFVAQPPLLLPQPPLPLPLHQLQLLQPQPQSLSVKSQSLSLPQLQHTDQLQSQLTDLPQLMLSLSQFLPLLMSLDMESKEMPTPEVLSLPTTRTAMDTTLLENTVLLFPMAVPRLSHTVLMMLTLDMLLMLGTRELPSPMKPPSQPMLQHLHQHMPQLPKYLMLILFMNNYLFLK